MTGRSDKTKLLNESVPSSVRNSTVQGSAYPVLRRLLLLFLPLAFLFIGAGVYVYQIQVESDLKKIRSSETKSLDLGVGAGLSNTLRELPAQPA
jgi:hypothetical protein